MRGVRAGAPREPTSSRSIASLLIVSAILACGAVLLGLHVQRYPVTGSVDTAAFALPDVTKLMAMLRALAWLALINFSAWSFGSLAETRLPLPKVLSDLRFVFRMGVGLALIAFGVLLLASLHLLLAPAFALLLLTPVVLQALHWWLHARHEQNRLWRPSVLVSWAMLAYALLLVNAYFHVWGSDLGWDALTYHLSFPARYLAENGVVMTPFSHLSGYIVNTQMLYLLALALDGDGLAVLINFEFGLLTITTVSLLASRVSQRAALLAPLFLLADPLFQYELGWAYADLSLAFYATLAGAAFSAWLNDDRDTRALSIAGVCCGLACATRYLGASVGLALVVLAWLPPRHRKIRENLRASALLAVLSALVMLPWLIRNAALTGNPITPLLQSLFHAAGAEFIPPIVMEQNAGFLRFVGMGRDLPALFALPWNLVINSEPGTYKDSFGFQIGPLYVVGVLAALVVTAARRHSLVSALAKVALIYTILWFYAFQEARFLLPIFPMLAVVGAVGFDRAARLAAPWGRVLLGLPVLAVLFAQLSMLPSLPREYRTALGLSQADGQTERGAVAAATYLRSTMRDDDRLMLWLEERAYLFRGLDYIPYHIGSGSPALALVHSYPHGEALRCALVEMGVMS